MMLAVATDDIANMTITAVTSCAQTKSGSLPHVIPGARILQIVTTVSSAAMSAAISVKVTICAYTSTRLPMPYCGPDNGT